MAAETAAFRPRFGRGNLVEIRALGGSPLGMHELFTLNEIVPVDPGTSPFQVRGVIYDRTLEHAKAVTTNPGAFIASLRDERVRRFMAQPFKWTGLYDALPLCPVQISLCRLEGSDFEAGTRVRSAKGAQQLIPRMFRLVLGFTRPHAWALHAPRLMNEYCGFGEVRIANATDEGAVFEIATVPQFLAASHVNTLIGIFEGTLALLHARNFTSRYFDVKRAGERDGHPLLSYKLQIGWS